MNYYFQYLFFLHGTNFKISVFICTALFQIKINPLKKKEEFLTIFGLSSLVLPLACMTLVKEKLYIFIQIKI